MKQIARTPSAGPEQQVPRSRLEAIQMHHFARSLTFKSVSAATPLAGWRKPATKSLPPGQLEGPRRLARTGEARIETQYGHRQATSLHGSPRPHGRGAD